MGDNSEAGQQRHQVMVDAVMEGLEAGRPGRTKTCEGMHALYEATTLYMAREMPTQPEKLHGLDVAAELALRTGYEAAGVASRDGEHSPEAQRLHDGLRLLTTAVVRAVYRGGHGDAQCPNCISAAVLMGLANALMAENVAPDAAIRTVQERASALRVNGPAPIDPGLKALLQPPANQ
ncbi:hypothetical protein E4T66_17600 [Sinimarinibacterium sp. CAU 1509]|uniref:hypothetical protein n=1 Tax=Sinimarinibacterium sp. CAU 1509 TaxID=2562283 RepID=UPI0010ACB560|nr:hypothetical protein [Sinimarinibacterium sp. CAU 1509]TJY57223.1 hypothetical protein E4T66_17600 [Sinimarinibacterium sp. CAU 1509]